MIYVNLFLLGWIVSSWITTAVIIFNSKWLKYLCGKCITFWTSLLYCYHIGYNFVDGFFISAGAAFIYYVYQILEEKWN